MYEKKKTETGGIDARTPQNQPICEQLKPPKWRAADGDHNDAKPPTFLCTRRGTSQTRKRSQNETSHRATNGSHTHTPKRGNIPRSRRQIEQGPVRCRSETQKHSQRRKLFGDEKEDRKKRESRAVREQAGGSFTGRQRRRQRGRKRRKWTEFSIPSIPVTPPGLPDAGRFGGEQQTTAVMAGCCAAAGARLTAANAKIKRRKTF